MDATQKCYPTHRRINDDQTVSRYEIAESAIGADKGLFQESVSR
jgi:hypothetical protein